MSEKKISSVEYQEWMNNNITKKLYSSLKEHRTYFTEYLISGETLNQGLNSIDSTAKIVGIIKGIDLVLNIKVND